MENAQAPYLLAALPQLQDETFGRGVILVLNHDKEGAFGLLLNRPMRDEEGDPTQMTAEVKDVSGNVVMHVTEDLFQGGPVNDEAIYALHEIESLGSEEQGVGASSGVYLATDPELFQKLLEKEEHRPKRAFFLGCSSWDPGQLETETRTGSWLIVPFDRAFVFDEPNYGDPAWSDDFWKRVLRKGGVDPLTLIGPSSNDAGPN